MEKLKKLKLLLCSHAEEKFAYPLKDGGHMAKWSMWISLLGSWFRRFSTCPRREMRIDRHVGSRRFSRKSRNADRLMTTVKEI